MIVRLSVLGKLLPPALRRRARDVLWRRGLRKTVRKLAALSLGQMPKQRLILDLRDAWDNEGYVADLDYLHEVASYAATTGGPILECGSGLSTILLGCLAGRRGVPVWSLEDNEQWRQRTAVGLDPISIGAVQLCLAPMRDYGSYMWYDPPLVRMPSDFRLVICDGPPGVTPGGRYGLLPVMGSRLARGVVILLDDADRASEVQVLARWSQESGVTVKDRTLPGGRYAVATCP
jgi:hypothetical protein